ncbi:hypothetical protein M5689_016881 [Euphorbia peplus]|nr:hypothetical protein M5689_016881 [Euphorbia peplus]
MFLFYICSQHLDRPLITPALYFLSSFFDKHFHLHIIATVCASSTIDDTATTDGAIGGGSESSMKAKGKSHFATL